MERSYFVRTAGFYSEWLRQDWLKQDPTVLRFEPDNKIIMQTAALWLENKPDMERRFFETRLPLNRRLK
jgi:hypothetical protein